MLRALALVASLVLLAGCASTPSYRYYGERSYSDGYGGEVVYSVGSTYDRRDWDAPLWYDYPGYYSLFWSINRWYVDPYWYPHFYYGVTWFPRDYFSVIHRHWYGPSLRVGWYGRPWYGYLAYSPYRYSWIDHYYDWYPWYVSYPHYHRFYTPRYGNPRNEAERLSRYSAAFRGGGLPADQLDRYSAFSRAARSQALVDARREAWRGADYGSDGGRGRIDPEVSGFRQGNAARAALPSRGSAGGARQDPRVTGFRAPESAARSPTPPSRSALVPSRRWDQEGVAYPYRSSNSRERHVVEEREGSGAMRLPAERVRSAPSALPRAGSQATEPVLQRSERTRVAPLPPTRYQVPRGAAAEAAVVRGDPPPARRATEVPQTPRYETPARAVPSYPTPRYEAPRREAPRHEAPRYEAPRREPAPSSAPTAPERSAPAPREESRSPRAARDEE